MRHLFLAAVAAATFAGPVLADPPSWAPANGWRAAQYQDQGDQRERDNRDRWRREHGGDESGYNRGYYDQQRADQQRGDEQRGYQDQQRGDQQRAFQDQQRAEQQRAFQDQQHGDRRYGDRRDGYQQQNTWYPDQHYRYSRRYQTRYIGQNEQIWRGRDNRYYCRRSDGTAGLIIGGIGGGVLGDAIAPGGSKTLGALLGGGLGAVLGSSIDRNHVRCR